MFVLRYTRLGLVAFALPLWGQTSCEITGAVTDASGAVIEGSTAHRSAHRRGAGFDKVVRGVDPIECDVPGARRPRTKESPMPQEAGLVMPAIVLEPPRTSQGPVVLGKFKGPENQPLPR